MAYLPPGADSQNTTPNVNYTAISEGKICAWFLGEVEALRQNDVAWPSYSHGFDPLLAVVHRDQPMLSYACDPASANSGAHRVTCAPCTAVQRGRTLSLAESTHALCA